jgi:Ran GTPase-activating protein (RanGAP) involved in mRNA processing and transport
VAEKEGEVIFTARYKDWVVIKKLSIDQSTTPQEVSAILASIEATISRKSYQFSGINQQAIEAIAKRLAQGKRKSFSSLSEVFAGIKPTELKSELLAACPTEAHLPIAENYLVKAVLDILGFKTNLDVETLSQAYPEIKVPKPKGNFGRKQQNAGQKAK